MTPSRLPDLCLNFGSYRLLPKQRLLLDGERPLPLGSRAFDILVALVEQAGALVSAEELMRRVWGDAVVDAGSLRVHVAALRKALGEGRGGQRYITNVPMRGYAFVAPVSATQTPAERPTEEVAAAAPPIAETAPRPTSLPAPPPLLGRDELIAEIAAQFPRRRCISIVGPGGMGKTALGLALAERLYPTLAHQAVWVELAPLTDARRVASTLASVLGIGVDPAAPIPAIARFLRDKQMLIVLDNCEHVVDAAAELAEQLLRAAPRVQVIATSREALRIEGEWLQRLAPLRLPPAGTQSGLGVADAMAYPSVQLFVERASAGQDGFALTPADVSAVCEICRRLDGIPLAIELAAASVGALGVQGIAALLEDRLSLLVHGRRTALPRHQTLRATLDWSFRLLLPAEQSMLLRLSVFRGPFTLESAIALCAGEDTGAPSDAADSLCELVDKSMLAVDPSGEQMMYRLLESTRAYALDGLAARGDTARMLRRHAEHLRDLFGAAEAEREQRPPHAWLATHGRRIEDLRAAVAWAFGPEGDVHVGVALAASSAPLWFALSLMAEFRALAEQALAALQGAAGPDPRREMQLSEAYGHALWHTRGGGPAMAATFTRALDLAAQQGVLAYQLRATWGLWLICNTTGDYAGSARLAERFGSIAGPAPPPDVALTHDRMMALGLHFHGEQGRAIVHATRVLQHPATVNHTARNSGFQFDQRVSALTVLARIHWVQGREQAALDHARMAVEESLAIGHTLSLCYAIANGAAPVAFWSGDWDTARRWTALLLDRAAEQSLAFWIAFGQAYQLLLDRHDAGTAVLPEPPRETLYGPAVGHLLRETLCTVDAGLADDPILARADGSGGSWCAPELLRVRSLRQRAAGDISGADATLQRALDLAREQQALAWEQRCLATMEERLRPRRAS